MELMRLAVRIDSVIFDIRSDVNALFGARVPPLSVQGAKTGNIESIVASRVLKNRFQYPTRASLPS